MRPSVALLTALVLPLVALASPALAGKDEPGARAAADAFRTAGATNNEPTKTWTAPSGHGVYLPFDGQGYVDVTSPKGSQRFKVGIDGTIAPYLTWGTPPADAEAQAKTFIQSGSLVERARGLGVSWYARPHLVVKDPDGGGWHRYTVAPGGGLRVDERVRRQKNGSYVTTTPRTISRQVVRVVPGRVPQLQRFDVEQVRGAGGHLGPVKVTAMHAASTRTYRSGEVYSDHVGPPVGRLQDAPALLDARYQAVRGKRAPRPARR